MAGKEGSPGERMNRVAAIAAELVEDDVALVRGFDAPKDAPGVERRAKALGAVLICARRVVDLAAATAKARAAADNGPEEDDPDDDDVCDLGAAREELKRRHARWDALGAAGAGDRRYVAPPGHGGEARVANAAPPPSDGP